MQDSSVMYNIAMDWLGFMNRPAHHICVHAQDIIGNPGEYLLGGRPAHLKPYAASHKPPCWVSWVVTVCASGCCSVQKYRVCGVTAAVLTNDDIWQFEIKWVEQH